MSSSRLFRNTQPSASGESNPPVGGSCKNGSIPPFQGKGSCGPPRLDRAFRRGILPTTLVTCDADAIVQPGRLQNMWVPDFIVWNFFADGVDFSPSAPLQAGGTKGVGNLTMSVVVPTVAGGRDATQGPRALVCGMVVSIQTSANVPPGDSTIQFAGTFQDQSLYTQTVQWTQGAVGNSRFIQMFSKEVQGGAYPALVELLAADYLVVQPGTTVAVTTTPALVPPITSIVFTAGIPFDNAAGPTPQALTATVTDAAQGTIYQVQTLSPVSDFYYWALAFWAESARQAGA